MTIEKLENYIVDILMKNSWTKDRQYDTTFWISRLTDEGYKINECAHCILRELGNIEIRERSTKTHCAVTMDFNPYFAASGEFDRIEDFEKACDDEIFPIGMLQDYIVYAGKSERIYIGDWTGLYLIGECIEDYLNNIFKIGYEPVKL